MLREAYLAAQQNTAAASNVKQTYQKKIKKVITYFIRQGNVTDLGVFLSLGIGLLILAVSLFLVSHHWIRIAGFSIGVLLMSFGGYSARAETLGLKPFDNSYEKARTTYGKSE